MQKTNNLRDLLAALRFAKINRKGFEVVGSEFTPQQTADLLGELYDLLAMPVVAEFLNQKGD